MKTLYLSFLLTFLFFPLFAQNDNLLSDSYEEFKRETWKEYEDFRQQCNMEYAEFMKHAWTEYGANPPVAIPVEQKVPVLFFDSQKHKTGNLLIEIEEAPFIPMEEVQPVPLCKISEVKPTDFSNRSLDIDSNIGEEALQRLLPYVKVKKNREGFHFFRRKKKAKENSLPNIQPQKVKEFSESEMEFSDVEPEPIFSELKFTFFGTEMKVRVLDDYKYTLANCDDETLSNAWKLLSTPRFNNTIRDCLELRYDYNLCDWAYVEMLQTMAEQYLGKDTNEAVFFAAYIYCQSGYQMRLARHEGRLYILVASKHFLYGHSFFLVEGQEFFTLEKMNPANRMQICNAAFKNESRLSLFIPKNVSLACDYGEVKTIKSSFYDNMSMTVKVNKNLMHFYENYPASEIEDNFMTRWTMYANSPLAPDVKEQIYPHLKEELKGHTTVEGVEMILHMLQTGLEYGFDNEVWGEDRAFFSEETLFYPLCDCEDRSILFSRLVRDIYGVKTLLVHFPGHLLTAVHFDEEVEGAYCIYNGEKYIFCDPTYVGAGMGRIYSQYEHETPSVILLPN